MKNKSYTAEIKNKKAGFEYHFLGTYTAGIMLSGTEVKSVREGKATVAEFNRGNLTSHQSEKKTDLPNGTQVTFIPDSEIFNGYKFNFEYIEKMLNNYAYLNVGLKLNFNGGC